MKKVLVLGAGLVAGPAVQFLLDQPDISVHLADQKPEKATELISSHPNGTALHLDVNNQSQVEKQISDSDIVISLLPWTLHETIAKHCLKYGKHLVTASYVQDEIQALGPEVKEKGLIFLNEVGVDPGLDHMSALTIIHRVQKQGGTVDSFFSYCGGLPAKRDNNNPLGYKFSWSPEGAMLAATNDGRYKEHGVVFEVQGEKLFEHYWLKSIPEVGVFEAYVNRDALPYMKKYGIEDSSGMYRGTLRNIGYCETWNSFKKLGLLNRESIFDFDRVTPREVMSTIVERKNLDIRSAVAKYLDIPVHSLVLKKMEWLGLFSRKKLPLGKASIFDMLAHMLRIHLVFDEGERDLVIMHHEFEVIYPGLPKKRIQSTLIDRGIAGGYSSMSRTVGYPVGIAASLIAAGKICLTGIQIPVLPEIYNPILQECEKLGIRFVERISDLDTDERSYWGD